MPPTQLPPGSNAYTSGVWKTHPRTVWPQTDITASTVTHLLFSCQLVQYLTYVQMAVHRPGSLVKNISAVPFNNLERPLEKVKLMWFFFFFFFYLKELRNIAAANSIITLYCQQQFNIFFSPEGYNTFAPWGSFFSLHLQTVPQTLPLFITGRSPAEIGTFVLLWMTVFCVLSKHRGLINISGRPSIAGGPRTTLCANNMLTLEGNKFIQLFN